MATFHFHFPTPPDDAREFGDPVDVLGSPGHDKLRAHWQAHRDDTPAVKPERDVVVNVRRAGVRRNRIQDDHYNGLVLLAWQMVQRDGLSIAAACAEVGIAQGTYRKRARRLELDASPVE